MAVLHIVGGGSAARSALVRCLTSVSPGDALLLLDDAVHFAIAGSESASIPGLIDAGCKIYVLRSSMAERGLMEAPLLAEFQAIGFDEFVDLTTALDSSVSWV
jgi:tRNA 2-thiouridine synthesizing protein B